LTPCDATQHEIAQLAQDVLAPNDSVFERLKQISSLAE
jgi:hypothetical protein